MTAAVDGWWRATAGTGEGGPAAAVATRTTGIRKPRVAFQGERGAYGDEAIERLWRGGAHPVASWTFDDVVRAVLDGRAEYGVIPVENTIVGLIAPTRAVLEAHPELRVLDATTIDIRHALLALPGATIAALTAVASHPVALRQCGWFLARHHHLSVREAYDTAGAAREVAAHRRTDEAAIASVQAAARYGLEVLAEAVQDVPGNRTRFVVVALGGGQW